MAESLRVRAAVVVALLAGDASVEAWSALDASDRDAAERVRTRIRAQVDRVAVARAIVAERFAVVHATSSPPPTRRGAVFYARWLRALAPPDRARIARGLTANDAALIAVEAPSHRALDASHVPTATWLVTRGSALLERLPSVAELAEVFGTLRAEHDPAGDAAVRLERMIRVAGRRRACETLALESS